MSGSSEDEGEDGWGEDEVGKGKACRWRVSQILTDQERERIRKTMRSSYKTQ